MANDERTTAGRGKPASRATALLLDMHALVHRAHHALPAMCTAAGEPTAALYGTSSLLCKLLRERRPTWLGFAFDEGNDRRRAIEPTYKRGRAAPPSDLVRQLNRARELPATVGGIPLSVRGEEGDDVIATATRELLTAGHHVLVVTGDRDLLQLVGPQVTVIFIGWRGGPHVDYDEAAVRARFAVEPAMLPSLRAFLGDPADDLPGVPSIGPRTAARWIAAHGDVAGVLARLDDLSPARLRPLVALHAEQLTKVESLSKLDDTLPLPAGRRYAPWDAAAREGLARWFEALEFRSLVGRLPPPTS